MALSKQQLKELKEQRTGLTNYNSQGCLMKIVEYNGVRETTVEFQDEYKYRTTTFFKHFVSGTILNPYFPCVVNVGIRGSKYPAKVDGKNTKEYRAWYNMLLRCYDERVHEKEPTYNKCECCNEWLLYENFYEWLHNQENFDKWYAEDYALDKDILIKGNKLYSPETCCLVPRKINSLFVKGDAMRGKNPIGVSFYKHNGKYNVKCNINAESNYYGLFDDPKEAFNKYKKIKEQIIQNIAKEEYQANNITHKCYEAMMKYEVNITD